MCLVVGDSSGSKGNGSKNFGHPVAWFAEQTESKLVGQAVCRNFMFLLPFPFPFPGTTIMYFVPI